jgi:tRNA G46 methylase TrmB
MSQKSASFSKQGTSIDEDAGKITSDNSETVRAGGQSVRKDENSVLEILPADANSVRKKWFRRKNSERHQSLAFEKSLEKVLHSEQSELWPKYFMNPLQDENFIQWQSLPVQLDVQAGGGGLPESRVKRKRQQIENLVYFIEQLLVPGSVVVDFCGGGGHLSIPLAFRCPHCSFVLLDMKQQSLDIAHRRATELNLTNFRIVNNRVEKFREKFDIGVALHACGEATDLVLDKCLEQKASYVLCPCCIGKVQNSVLAYPRSNLLKQVLASNEYFAIAKSADFNAGVEFCLDGEHTKAAIDKRVIQRRFCKSLVETDRNQLAREKNYTTSMYIMFPQTASPKNDILVGIAPDLRGNPLMQTDHVARSIVPVWLRSSVSFKQPEPEQENCNV